MDMTLAEVRLWSARLAPRAEAPSDDEADDGWPAGLGLSADAGRSDKASPLTAGSSPAEIKARIDARIAAAAAGAGG